MQKRSFKLPHNRFRQNHPKSYIKKTIPTKVRPFSNTYIWVKNMVKFWGHVSRPSRALQARDHFGPRQLKGINERIVLPHNLTFKGYISTLNQPEVVIIVNFETFTYWFLYFWCFFFTRMTKNPVGKGVNPIEYQDIVKIGQFWQLKLIRIVFFYVPKCALETVKSTFLINGLLWPINML